jgi:two-component system, NarL family, sensor histidine kinase UhpB
MAIDQTAAGQNGGRAAQLRAGGGTQPPAGGGVIRVIRPLLRLRLFYKLIVANVVILLVAVLICSGLAVSALRVNPEASITGAVLPVVLAAVAVSALVNALVVRLALTPLHHLEETARRVQHGDHEARVPVSTLADPELERVATTLNAMLDSVAEYRKRSRELTVRAFEASEAERRRIAAELHDGIAQDLGALLLQLRLVRGTQDTEKREGLLAHASQQLASTTEELRALARGMRPPTLDMLGLLAAVKAHARFLAESSNIRIEVYGDPVDRLLSPESELALYRLVQEALANVVRHSGARTATLEIGTRSDMVVATIEDDGRGFHVAETMAGQHGLGLFGMHERALHAGGRVKIASAPGRGTAVRIEFPREGSISHA